MTQVTRNVRLDGLRGLATVMVVFSHYLGEVPSRIPGFALGYIAVQIFFVLSGFLIGGLVLDRRESGNFFKVFYARRLLRTIPSYAVVVATIVGLAAFGSANWIP